MGCVFRPTEVYLRQIATFSLEFVATRRDGFRNQKSRADVTSRVSIAGWSSLVARQVHTLKVEGSNPSPATGLVVVSTVS